ncbi:MAG: glycosyltransferase [Vicingaceae bacterium]|nr:glycosyltransferase [Vicingaceae bacterium]
MKKVLIITYYWPPMGGGGVQRWVKMTKYLREFGWEPVIFTPKNGEIAILDEELNNEIPTDIEVVRTNIWEPFSLYKKLMGKKKDEKLLPGMDKGAKNSLAQRISIWVRGNVFIPDARKFWIKPASKALNNYLKSNKIDAIVSTGPPHSMHIIALNVVEKNKIPWLADFRDPWTNIDFYDKLMLSNWAAKKHKQLENIVLTKANEIVTVSWSWATDFEKICGRKPIVITNGYDPADFVDAGKVALDKKFTLVHAGSLNEDRNPTALWIALKELCDENETFKNDLEIKFIGQVAQQVINSIEKNQLTTYYNSVGNIPHQEVISHLIKAQLLLLPLNNTPNIDGIIPGKLYEYIGAQRPIVAIGKPTGDSAKIIQETQSGTITDFDAIAPLKEILLLHYEAYKNNTLQINSSHYEKYSRKVLAGKIAHVLDKITTA